MLDSLTDAAFVVWVASEVMINLISLGNRLRGLSQRSDRFSFFGIWLSIALPIWFAVMVRQHLIFPTGFGGFSTLSGLLGWVGCLVVIVGIAIRLTAVATLRRQFTVAVAIVAQHTLVNTGIYRIVRHPAYLGMLASMLGFGLASGNWISLAALVVLPLAATLYRIHVEEQALLRHFGPAYQEYACRTNRLFPGIY